MEHRRLDWLQALRGIAALGVVFTHARWAFSRSPWWDSATTTFLPCAGGVDLFFVISGFIMFYTTQTASNAADSLSFMKRRFLRIWPPYAALSIAVLFLFVGMHAFSRGSLHPLIKSLLFLPVNYDGIVADQTIGPGWTLNYEWYFYLVFGAAILFGKYRWHAFVTWMAIFLIGFPLLYHGSWNARAAVLTPYPVRYMRLACNPIISEFLLGIVAGAIFTSAIRIQSKTICYALIMFAALACIAAVWRLYLYINPFMGVAFFAVIVVLAICSKTVNLNPGAALTRLGSVSYTLYLVNYPIMLLLIKLFVPARTMLNGVIGFTVIVLCSLGAAFVLSPLLEHKLPAALVAVMTTIPNKIRSIQRQPAPMLVPARAAGAPPVASASRDMPVSRP
jgi:peptidoglycan/LPS O-acetylase OafA/YrhL